MQIPTMNIALFLRIILVAYFLFSYCLPVHAWQQVDGSNLQRKVKEPVHELKRPDPANVQKYLIKESPFGIAPEEAAHHNVMIFEPDGRIASQVWMQSLPADKQVGIDLSTFEQQPFTRLEQLSPDGKLVLDLTQLERTVFLKTEKGCILLSASRLLASDRVQLLAWSKVRVEIDKAFWLSSYPLVLKLDPMTLQALTQFRLTQSIRFSNLLPLKSGGVAAIEIARKDRLSSANRIWRIDSQAELAGRVDLGAYSISSCSELGSLLLARSIKATSMLSVREPNTQFLVADDFKSMSRFDALADVSQGLSDGDSVWVLDGKMLKRVTEIDNELITTASRVNEDGIVSIVAE